MQKKFLVFILVPVLLLSLNIAAYADSKLPENKTTVLEKYVTAAEAYAMYTANPTKVHILDVRTPGEYIFVGHAPMAANIPLKLLSPCVSPCGLPVMPMNPEFLAAVEARYNKTDTILVMCRSGNRSAMAINMMAQIGYTDLYNITDGFEGQFDADGKMTIDGWKNSGAPWTYAIDTNLICVTNIF